MSEPRTEWSQGYLHVVWTQRTLANGNREVRHARLTPGGTSFQINPQDGTRISDPQDAQLRFLTLSQPFLHVKAQGAQTSVHVAYTATRSALEAGNNVADIYLVSSGDDGGTWGDPVQIAASVVETAEFPFPAAYYAPANVLEVSASPSWRRWVFGMQLQSWVVGFYFTKDATDWVRHNIVSPGDCPQTDEAVEAPPTACLGPGFLAQRPDAASQGTDIRLVWQAVSPDNRWDVFKAEHSNFGTPSDWAVSNVTSTVDTVTSHSPAVGFFGNPNQPNYLWSDDLEQISCTPQPCPVWKVRGSRATAAISGADAFLPDAVMTTGQQVFAVYSRVNPGTADYDIYWNDSTDGGQLWGPERKLAETTNAPSLFPSVTYRAQGSEVWAVWREPVAGVWRIKGQRFVPAP